MKKFKQIKALFLVVIIAISCAINVSADEPDDSNKYYIKGTDAILNVPDDVYIFESGSTPSDEKWEKTNVESPYDALIQGRDLEALAVLGAGEKNAVILTKSKSATTQTFYDLTELSDEDFADFLTIYNDSEGDLKISATEYNTDTTRYIIVNTSGLTQEKTELYEVAILTIEAGYSLIYSINDDEAIPESSVELLKTLANNTEFVYDYGPGELSAEQGMFFLILFGIFLLVIISVVVFLIIRSRKRKKAIDTMADSLSIYRQKLPQRQSIIGDSVFVNSTEFSDKAIKTYSMYQCYVNKVVTPAISIALLVFIIISMMSMSFDWWAILIILATTVYYVFKFATNGTTLQKILKRMYKKIPNRTAKYTFYENDFFISGLESGEFHPYFQITSVREYKDYYYIYFGDDICYYIHKKGFEKGKSEEFREFIKRKTGKRF